MNLNCVQLIKCSFYLTLFMSDVISCFLQIKHKTNDDIGGFSTLSYIHLKYFSCCYDLLPLQIHVVTREEEQAGVYTLEQVCRFLSYTFYFYAHMR